MKYFKNTNNEIFAYEEDGSQDHLIQQDMVAITLDDVNAINQAKEDEYKTTVEYKIQEAKQYLISTDYKMTADYDKDVTDVRIKRAEARTTIRNLEAN